MRLELSRGEFKWANWVAVVSGGLGVVLGITVMMGWHLGVASLVQVNPAWVPMQYNTALCFFVAGASLISAALGQTRVPIVGGAFVAALGLLSGLQYGLGQNFGIDELLFTHTITVKTSSPGRMAPNTAMSFVFLGWAIALMGYRLRRQQPSSVAIMLASLTLGLALVALAGYATGLESAYGWGRFTSMAVPTAVGFVALGLGGSVFHWPRNKTQGTDVGRLTGILITVTTLGVLLIVMLSAAIGLIPFYEQVRQSLSDEVSQRLEGEVSSIQRLFAQTSGLADSLGEFGILSEEPVKRLPPSEVLRARLREAHQRVEKWPGPGKAYLGILQAKGAGVLGYDLNGNLQLLSTTPLVAQAITRGVRGENGITSSEDDKRELAFFNPVQGTAWVAVSTIPASELYAEADQKLLLISMIVMLVALCGAFGMARLLQPLTSGILIHSEEMQRRVNEATSELQTSLHALEDKNRELQEFSYVVSHDLQAPLRGINGFAGLLERKHADSLNDEGKEYIAFIRQGVEQMTGFIQGFLQLSRLGSRSQPMTAVDLNQVVSELQEQMRFAVDHEEVEFQTSNLPLVHGDASQLKQLFQNLIDNSVKFRASDRSLVIKISAAKQGERWRVLVADNGMGVNPAESEFIFKMFHRASATEDMPGTGIGLALCARIVHRHGGDITVEQTPRGGATFAFSLSDAEGSTEEV